MRLCLLSPPLLFKSFHRSLHLHLLLYICFSHDSYFSVEGLFFFSPILLFFFFFRLLSGRVRLGFASHHPRLVSGPIRVFLKAPRRHFDYLSSRFNFDLRTSLLEPQRRSINTGSTSYFSLSLISSKYIGVDSQKKGERSFVDKKGRSGEKLLIVYHLLTETFAHSSALLSPLSSATNEREAESCPPIAILLWPPKRSQNHPKTF